MNNHPVCATVAQVTVLLAIVLFAGCATTPSPASNPGGALPPAQALPAAGATVRGDRRLAAIGGLTLKQSDCGITPFSILAGALRVRDALRVSFRFVAAPAG